MKSHIWIGLMLGLPLISCLKTHQLPKFEGRVINPFTGEGIPNVRVDAYHLETSSSNPGANQFEPSMVTTTNANGLFGFDQDAPIVRLDLMHPDYISRVIELPPGDDLALNVFHMDPGAYLHVSAVETNTSGLEITAVEIQLLNSTPLLRDVLIEPLLVKLPAESSPVSYRVRTYSGATILEQYFDEIALAPADTTFLELPY